SAAFDKLGPKANAIAPLFITVDPDRDTPDVLKNYLDAFGKRFVGLTGTRDEVTETARDYHVFFQKRSLPGGDYTMDHSSVIYLMGPDGKFLTSYSIERGPDAIASDLAKQIH